MKILVVKTSALGDIIHTFPTIAFLRQKFPAAQIDWVVEAPFAELVESHPLIDRVLLVETKQWRKGRSLESFFAFRRNLRQTSYDIVFDFQGNLKSGLITAMAKAKQKAGFGWKTVPEKPNLLFTNWRTDPPKGKNIREDYLFLVQEFFQDHTSVCQPEIKLSISEKQQDVIRDLLAPLKQPRIMVCPGSAWPNKQMETDALIRFLHIVSQKTGGTFLLVWGNEEEKSKAWQIHDALPNSKIVDKLPIPVLQNLMDQMDLIIAMDSLPLHLAGTTSASTFSVFGPSSSEKYKPLGTKHRSYQGTCPYGRSFDKRCPILRTCKTGACIRSLDLQKLVLLYNSSL